MAHHFLFYRKIIIATLIDGWVEKAPKEDSGVDIHLGLWIKRWRGPLKGTRLRNKCMYTKEPSTYYSFAVLFFYLNFLSL